MGHSTCKIVPTTGIIGAIAGDCFGAAYEFHSVKHGDFDIYKEPRFTDDTVMTLAVAKWLTIDPEHTHEKLVECMKELGRKYMFVGYGQKFLRWIISRKTEPYNSYGNGSAMRVSPCGFYAKSSHILKQIVILLLSVMPSLLAVMLILWRAWLEE